MCGYIKHQLLQVFPLTTYLALCRLVLKINSLRFKRRVKSHLTFSGIIMSPPYSPRYQDKG